MSFFYIFRFEGLLGFLSLGLGPRAPRGRGGGTGRLPFTKPPLQVRHAPPLAIPTPDTHRDADTDTSAAREAKTQSNREGERERGAAPDYSQRVDEVPHDLAG